jgi:hypothetical protein
MNQREYELTRSKLEDLRRTIAKIESRPAIPGSSARAASLRSLRAYEIQLVEELIRYETAHGQKPQTLGRTR